MAVTAIDRDQHVGSGGCRIPIATPASTRRWAVSKQGRHLRAFALGLMREEAAHPDEDPYRYRVEWGFAPTSAGNVTNWTELSWNEISLRTAPGPMTQYTAKFVAPSDKVVIAVRAWKKWGTVQRELDVNLDAIKLVQCGSGGRQHGVLRLRGQARRYLGRHRQEEWHNGGRPDADERDQESRTRFTSARSSRCRVRSW